MAGRIKGILEFVSEAIKDAKYDRAEFDPRFYPGGKLRVKDSPEYRPNVIDTGTMIPKERLALQDLEGRPYFTTMSDRTAAGGLLEGIGNKPLAHPIRLTGGQDYMRDDTGELWASAKGVVPEMVKTARQLEDQYGVPPVFMPWRMAPSGGDFAHMTGQTMLSWAAGNMPKVYKKQLDADMKKFVPDWVGVDDPKSLEQYGALSDTQRKAAMNMIDVEYRNKGGISQTQARLAVADQSQLLSPVSGFQNVGEVDLKRGVLEGAGNATYPSVLAGKYSGTLDTDVTAMDLNPERYARALKKDGTFDTGPQGPDFLDTRAAPRRAMEVGYWGGLIDEPLLRRLSEEGFKVNSGLLPGVATAGVAGASLLGSEDADAGVTSGTKAALRNVFPAPQRMFDPNSKDFKPFLSEFEQQPGGRYLEMGENGPVDITGQYPASANISVGPDGKPKFQVAGEQRSGTPPNEGRKIKTNLFKKKAGWKWSQVPEGYDPEPAGNFPIVSVQDGKNHYYTVDAQFPDGVDLARYEKSASEPRLRPTRKGSVQLGEQIGEIDVRGKKHPVYGSAVIRQAAPVATAGLLGAGVLGSEDADASPLTAFTDKGNRWLQKLLAEAEQADLPQSAIDQGYSPSILQHVGEPGLQGYDLNAAAVANENSVSGMYNYPTKRESDRYLDQMQRYRDKSLEQYETVTRGDKAFVIGGDTPTPEMEKQFLSELEDAFKVKYSELPEHKQGWFDEKVDQFLRYGDLTASPLSRDAKNRIYRAGGADVLVRNGREIVSLKPEQVRSPKAQFNIDDQGSNNFMASVAGAGVLGALALPQNSQAQEYTEAPVIEEQSFGSMVQEYGDINRRAKAADDKKFGLLMAEQDRLAAMPGGSWGKASPELSEYRRSQLLPTVAEIGMGGADAVVSGLDFLSNIPGAAATMNWQGATPIRDRLGGLLDYTFVDERDQRARDSARLLGGLLSPI